jgi:hypothetical protein
LIDAFGNGSLDQAVANMEAMARFGADLARSFGTIAKYSGIGLISGVIGALQKKRNELAVKDRPYDPMSGNMPDMTPAGMKIVMARKKADADAAKRQKELAALAVKQTKAIKEQTALTKAKAVLDKASAVMNMDLIQNTAALMGKVTEDESLRLKLQQAILLGNADAAGGLAQQLLSSQIAAMKLSSTNPLGGFTNSLDAALQAARQLRNELAMMGAAKVPIQIPQEIKSLVPEPEKEIQKTPQNPLGLPSFYGYSGFGQSFLPSKYPTDLTVTIVAPPGFIADTVINNSANGNSNSYFTEESFAGGRG